MIEQSNSNNVKKKKSTWLSNSTYVPIEVVQYSDQEEQEEINFNSVLDSDDSRYERKTHKRRKEKKKHHKKVKIRDILKHYLSQLPSIDDTKCQYRRMIFSDELPRAERQSAYFLDQRGNPYISQYGSVCDKHVPKYRINNKSAHSNFVSNRYYSILKKPAVTEFDFKSSKNQRKECDSHCICQQSFIPVPYDIVGNSDKSLPGRQNQEAEYEMVEEVAAINELLNREPHNISAWIDLVTLHGSTNHSGVATSVVVEKQLMVVERALSKNQSNLRLHLLRMRFGGEVWPLEKVLKEWTQLLFVWSTEIDVWRFYVGQMRARALGFSVDKIVGIYCKCFTTFFSVMSGRMRTKTITAADVMAVCDLFSEYCDFLVDSGYPERALACWQLNLEYNLFPPLHHRAPRQSGAPLDDPMLQSLQHYWTSSNQHLGQPDSPTWRSFTATVPPCPLQTQLHQYIEDVESETLTADCEQSEAQMWLHLEQERQTAWWIPCFTEQDDPDRSVPFQALHGSLITLHNPCNLTNGADSTLVSKQAKKRLWLLFLDHLSVFHHRVSIRHNLAPSRIRVQQMRTGTSLNRYLAPLNSERRLLGPFIERCLYQMRLVIDDSEDRSDLGLLELCYRVQRRMSVATGWKEVMQGMRESAKEVLAEYPSLWCEYARMLVDMAAIIGKNGEREAGRVLNALRGLEGDEGIVVAALRVSMGGEAADGLYEVAELLAARFRLNGGQRTLSSVCLLCLEIMTRIEGDCELWWLVVFVDACARLLMIDIEPFNAWVGTDCLSIIRNIGQKNDWSTSFLYDLSQFLEMITSFFGRIARSRDLNEGAFLRAMLTPILKTLTEVQSTRTTPIIDIVFSPKLLLSCIGQKSQSCQKLSIRNFLWHVVGCTETETATVYNHISHGSSLLVLDVELERLRSLAVSDQGVELFSGRTDRIRSTFNRLLALQCMHWRFRLALWSALMQFEAVESGADNCEERTKGVFYRAVTEMPAQKCLYLLGVSLVPSLVTEATTLMKDNGIRICAPLEEIKLLLRIRESSKQKSIDESLITQ